MKCAGYTCQWAPRCVSTLLIDATEAYRAPDQLPVFPGSFQKPGPWRSASLSVRTGYVKLEFAGVSYLRRLAKTALGKAFVAFAGHTKQWNRAPASPSCHPMVSHGSWNMSRSWSAAVHPPPKRPWGSCSRPPVSGTMDFEGYGQESTRALCDIDIHNDWQ